MAALQTRGRGAQASQCLDRAIPEILGRQLRPPRGLPAEHRRQTEKTRQKRKTVMDAMEKTMSQTKATVVVGEPVIIMERQIAANIAAVWRAWEDHDAF